MSAPCPAGVPSSQPMEPRKVRDWGLKVPACSPEPSRPSDAAWDDAATVIRILGIKWTLRMLRALQDKPLRHNELMRSLDGIHPSVLADTLRHMQAAGLVNRDVDPGPPPGVTYSLTSLAHEMLPLVTALAQWVDEHLAELASHEAWRRLPGPSLTVCHIKIQVRTGRLAARLLWRPRP